MQLGSEADKAKAIRAIRGLRADGHFTDLGAALDAAKRDLDELGQAQRPKYVLLITDERQEAPKGSPYAAPDYRLKHPSLEYIKRVDLGKFRVITVGLQVGAKVEKAVPAVMEFLQDAPQRTGIAWPEPPQATSPGTAAGSAPGAENAAGPGATPSAKEATPRTEAATPAERALPAWLLYAAAGLLIAALAGLAFVLVLSRRKEKEKDIN
jgi:hypothetical protein